MSKSFILTAIAILMCSLSATAQSKFGVTTTYSISTAGAEDTYRDLSRKTFSDKIMYMGESRSAGIGVSLFHDFSFLYLRTEALYTREEQSYTIKQYSRSESGLSFANKEVIDSRHMISIPITAGVQLSKVQLGVGPVLSFVIDNENSLLETNRITYQQRSLEAGFQFYAGYAINQHITISARYESSFQTVGNRYRYDDQPMNFDVSPQRLDIAVSFYL